MKKCTSRKVLTSNVRRAVLFEHPGTCHRSLGDRLPNPCLDAIYIKSFLLVAK